MEMMPKIVRGTSFYPQLLPNGKTGTWNRADNLQWKRAISYWNFFILFSKSAFFPGA